MQNNDSNTGEILKGLKHFDNHDWDAWSGAHGENPLIGYFAADDKLKELGKCDEVVIILDTEGIGIYMFDEEGDCSVFFLVDESNTDKLHDLMNRMEIPINYTQIEELGFRRVW